MTGRHLISCLEKKRFQPFPKIQGTVNINAREFITIKFYYSCRLPEKYDRNSHGGVMVPLLLCRDEEFKADITLGV